MSRLAQILRLPASMVAGIVEYAQRNVCYADRLAARGFRLEARAEVDYGVMHDRRDPSTLGMLV